jgi:hypothetical protein
MSAWEGEFIEDMLVMRFVLKLAGAESSGGGQGEARGETVARGTQ